MIKDRGEQLVPQGNRLLVVQQINSPTVPREKASQCTSIPPH